MLHTEVVSGKTLELLKKLEAENAMTRFNLAGGTSLALYLGHRRSVDLDLFTPKPFDAAELERFLMDKYGFRTGFMERNTLKGSIDGIKIDCITHSYEYLEKPYIEYGIRLYSMQDIIAMKLSAISSTVLSAQFWAQKPTTTWLSSPPVSLSIPCWECMSVNFRGQMSSGPSRPLLILRI